MLRKVFSVIIVLTSMINMKKQVNKECMQIYKGIILSFQTNQFDL